MSEGASSSRDGQVRRRGGETVVQDLGPRKSPCGYCKSPQFTSISHGLWAHTITVDDYQDLLDQGWRRSGSYLYKPEMDRTCCPSYTIRLKACKFIPSKEQKRVLKRMERFLDGMSDSKNKTESTVSSNAEMNNESASRLIPETCKDEHLWLLERKIDEAVKACFQTSDVSSNFQLPCASVKRVMHEKKKKLKEISEGLAYTSGISFKIAASLRRYEIAHKNDPQRVPRNIFCDMGDSSSSFSCSDLSECKIAERLAHSMRMREERSSQMTVKACNGHLNFYSSVDYVPYSQQSSEDDSRNSDQPPEQIRRQKLEIGTKRSSFDPEEFELYRRYQIRVHGDKPDKVNKSQYYRFLVETPLQFVPGNSKDRTGVPPCGFGSFHQQYRIDGKLVAVGVVDILPRCLSSKYLFWDPDWASLSLGKYSALREIDWVRKSKIHCPHLEYYYMGYYIHSCRKMRYKASYRPSELLCPLRYEWIPFEKVRALLDKKSYVVLSDYASFQDQASLPSQLNENSICSAPNDRDREGCEGYLSNEDGDMEVNLDSQESESDNDQLEPEAGELNTPNVSDIVLECNGTRVKFKDMQKIFRRIQLEDLRHLELQLQRYARTVGTRLACSIIYQLQ